MLEFSPIRGMIAILQLTRCLVNIGHKGQFLDLCYKALFSRSQCISYFCFAGLHSHSSSHSHPSHASQREGFYHTAERDGKIDRVDGTLAASSSYSGRSSPGLEHPRRLHSDTVYLPMGVSLPRSRSNSGCDGPAARLLREPSDSK